jgi:hypothetical protein
MKIHACNSGCHAHASSSRQRTAPHSSSCSIALVSQSLYACTDMYIRGGCVYLRACCIYNVSCYIQSVAYRMHDMTSTDCMHDITSNTDWPHPVIARIARRGGDVRVGGELRVPRLEVGERPARLYNHNQRVYMKDIYGYISCVFHFSKLASGLREFA